MEIIKENSMTQYRNIKDVYVNNKLDEMAQILGDIHICRFVSRKGLKNFIDLIFDIIFYYEGKLMITAKEANKQTKENIEKFQTEELRHIKEIIEECVADGCFYFTHDGYLSETAKNRLKSLGYKIITGTQYNECYYTVSWEDV